MTSKPNSDGCTAENLSLPNGKGNFIFMVDRRHCNFVSKVRTSQTLGAVAAIIADNVCLCSNYDKGVDASTGHTQALHDKCDELALAAVAAKRFKPNQKCASVLPYMADDGSGGDISIPSFIVDFFDAQKMKDCILASEDASYSPLTGKNFGCLPGKNLFYVGF